MLKHPNLPHALASAVDVSGFNLSKDAYFDKSSMVSVCIRLLLYYNCSPIYPNIFVEHKYKSNCGTHQYTNNAMATVLKSVPAAACIQFVVFLLSNNALFRMRATKKPSTTLRFLRRDL